MNTLQKEQEPSQETEAAATRIQAGYHGYKTRRQYHAQVYSNFYILLFLHAFRFRQFAYIGHWQNIFVTFTLCF